MTGHDLSFEFADIVTWPVSAPISVPRKNAFGTMYTRPALFIQITLCDGTIGWGEAFCNWPAFANDHRARIVSEILAPLALNQSFADPASFLDFLTGKTQLIATQCGEPGPFSSALAALEIAAWDAIAKRNDAPLWSLLGSGTDPTRVYASGLTPDTIDTLVPPLVDEGWTAFKLKIGFEPDLDKRGIDQLRNLVGPNALVMVDVNQAWDPNSAKAAFSWLSEHNIFWIEEPISADCSQQIWEELNLFKPSLIAAGENVRGLEQFSQLAAAGVDVLQPDPIKWGGLSSCAKVAEIASQNGNLFCPHYLGGGVGLAATSALCTAMQADFLEVDVTENRLRDTIFDKGKSMPIHIVQGRLQPSMKSGHGGSPQSIALEML